MHNSLRIGIDGRILGSRAKGIARYIWELCKGLDTVLPGAEFFIYSRDPIGLRPISSRWHQRSESDYARRMPKSFWAVTRPGFMARHDRVDVFWGGTGLLPLIGLSARSVLSVHDLVYKLNPESMSWRARWTMRLFFKASLSRADVVLTNSQGTADRLAKTLGYRAAATVIPGLSPQFTPKSESCVTAVLARHNLQRPYLLSVGTLEPRKGMDVLLCGFEHLRDRSKLINYTLALAGDRGWGDSALLKQLSQSGPSVRWLGFVNDDELVPLYSGCEAFIFPSKYEGFGMPVLEARACGARVVASNSPELREAGGKDAIYVEPNEAGVASGILAAISSPKKAFFDWRQQSWIASSEVLARALAP
jgi:glycosyltransferase involved in cell wall biosynthesis